VRRVVGAESSVPLRTRPIPDANSNEKWVIQGLFAAIGMWNDFSESAGIDPS